MSVQPGLHQNVPYDEYAAWRAVRSSQLKGFSKSALHAHYEDTHPHESSALTVGTALHTAILEPAKWLATYAVAPKLDRRTKEGKAEWAAFNDANKDRIVLAAKEYEQVEGMATAARSHPVVSELLASEGVNEASALWDEEDGGCGKCRIDRLCNWNGAATIVDFKSARDASPRGFARAVTEYLYAMSAGFYARGLRTLAPAERQFVFVAIEKAPPFAVGVYPLDREYLEVGEKQAMAYYAKLRKARDSGEWSGYPSTELLCPEWLFEMAQEGSW